MCLGLDMECNTRQRNSNEKQRDTHGHTNYEIETLGCLPKRPYSVYSHALVLSISLFSSPCVCVCACVMG